MQSKKRVYKSMDKPFSQACVNNQASICGILERVLTDKNNVLEIGSGTGQHGVFFAHKMPHLSWQMSDQEHNHTGIKRWVSDHPGPNLLNPIALNVLHDHWPTAHYDAIYSANTAHIMPWDAVVAMFSGAGEILSSGGVFCLYGPMKYLGVLDAQSNVEFDYRLQQQSSHQGIREFHDINSLAIEAGMVLREDNSMPANNRLIVWQKS
jgi:cyclopropane fatty-acyl-phospholipid synthase-like methyltransferase